MNIAALFVRRPVMTVLVMMGILIFGLIGVSATAGQRAAQRRFPDHSGAGTAPGREPGHHGLGRCYAAGEAVLDYRRHRLDDVDVD